MFLLDIQNSTAIILSVLLVVFSLKRDFQRFVVSYAVILPVGVFFLLEFNTFMPFLVIILSVISAKYLYSRLFFIFSALLLALSAILIYTGVGNILWIVFDISLGIGTAVALVTDKQSITNVSFNNNSKGVSRKKEVSRDLVQIAAGMVILALLFSIGQIDFRIVISLAVMPLYIFGNYYSLFPDTRIGRTLLFFERPMTPLGLGSIWFAAGILIAIGLVQSLAMLAVIVFVATIGDPIATIFGSLLHSPKLPYNRKKSVAGFLGIFIFTGVFAYFLIGDIGIGIALISAFLESISIHPLDDNFILPVILGAISYVI